MSRISRTKIVKKILKPIWVPATKRYIQKDRSVVLEDMNLNVPSGIFHPSLFFSTKTMLHYLKKQDLAHCKVLEIGSGSGALSIFCAQQNADVTACDINQDAVSCTLKNAERNNVNIRSVHSNLFEKIPSLQFDLIINNPPYYPRDPENMEEHAWYAGKDFNFFTRLFQSVKDYLNPNGQLLLVLTADCNLQEINRIASDFKLKPDLLYQRNTLVEISYIYGYKSLT